MRESCYFRDLLVRLFTIEAESKIFLVGISMVFTTMKNTGHHEWNITGQFGSSLSQALLEILGVFLGLLLWFCCWLLSFTVHASYSFFFFLAISQLQPKRKWMKQGCFFSGVAVHIPRECGYQSRCFSKARVLRTYHKQFSIIAQSNILLDGCTMYSFWFSIKPYL